MNVKADKLTTTFLTDHKTRKEDGRPLSNSAHFHAIEASLINNDKRVPSRVCSSISCLVIQTKQYDSYFKMKHTNLSSKL